MTCWIDRVLLTEVGKFSSPISATTEELLAMLAVAKKYDKLNASQILSITLALHCHIL